MSSSPQDRFWETAASVGMLFVVSSPSGAGKTTLCRRLMNEFPDLAFSVSYTTRPRRGNEIDGRDYHFVDECRFDQMISSECFVEWAVVHGYRYGTARATIAQDVSAGKSLLFDVDWQGGRVLKSAYPRDTVMVFVLPPSLEVLKARLEGRGTESAAGVTKRFSVARDELRHFNEYGYIIVNDDLERAYDEIRAIYIAERCALVRRPDLARALI